MPFAKVEKVEFLPVNIPAEAKWADYEHLTQIWAGLKISTAKQFAAEMRDSKEFRDGIINPTHKLAFVNIARFEDFIAYKERTRYRKS
jgi:hypothetical protein